MKPGETGISISMRRTRLFCENDSTNETTSDSAYARRIVQEAREQEYRVRREVGVVTQENEQQALHSGSRTPHSGSSHGSFVHHNLPSTVSLASTESSDDRPLGNRINRSLEQRVMEERARAEAETEERVREQIVLLQSNLVAMAEREAQLNPHGSGGRSTPVLLSNLQSNPTHRSKMEANAEQNLHARIRNEGATEMTRTQIGDARGKAKHVKPLKLESSKSLTSKTTAESPSPKKKLFSLGGLRSLLSNSSNNHLGESKTSELTSLGMESAKAAQILGAKPVKSRIEHTSTSMASGLFSPIENEYPAAVGLSRSASIPLEKGKGKSQWLLCRGYLRR